MRTVNPRRSDGGAYGNDGLWKAWKTRSRFPPLSHRPWKSRGAIPTFPQARIRVMMNRLGTPTPISCHPCPQDGVPPTVANRPKLPGKTAGVSQYGGAGLGCMGICGYCPRFHGEASAEPVEMTVRGKRGKPEAGFPLFRTALGNRPGRFPHSHRRESESL